MQLGCVVLPKASSIEHLKNNFDLDFEISDEDMEKIENSNAEVFFTDNPNNKYIFASALEGCAFVRNSVTVNVIEEIAKEIRKVLENGE